MRPPFKKIISIILIVIFCFSATSVVYAEPEKQKESSEKEEKKPVAIKPIKHVFLIGVEGMVARDLDSSPNIAGLAAGGTKISSALGVLPARFPVAVASLLTGQEPNNHSYINKGDNFTSENLINIYQKSNRNVLFIDGTQDGLNDLGKTSKVYKSSVKTPKQGVEEIKKDFPKELPYLTTLFLSVGPGENSVRKIDQEIGQLFPFLHQQGVYEYSLFIVAGIDGKEGFFTLKGPGVKGGITIPSGRLIDAFPTIINVTDGHVPKKLDGLVLWDSLQVRGGYSELTLLQKTVNELRASQVGLNKSLNQAVEDRRLALREEKDMELEKQKVLNNLKEKDKEIKTLNLKIGAMKVVGFMMVIGFVIGYVIEFFILRKKFLMF